MQKLPGGFETSRLIAVSLTVGLLATSVVGCGDDEDPAGPDQVTNQTGDAPLSDWNALFEGVPDPEKLPEEFKADQELPVRYDELVTLQSPVKSQGGRGVCSIFSTTALMEHLYIKEGTIASPDFSEQYLQWSAKFEVGSFPNTSGSNASSNLKAINQFGIPAEAAWPYEGSKWGTSNNPECDGEDDQPTICYTNGEPPASALEAQRFHLPPGRWMSNSPKTIKTHLINQGQAAIVGLTFYYQSWNHRGSTLTTSDSYWRKGYVTYPNAVDKEKSLEKRAGHSILLVGWDDELTVPMRDENGDEVLDEAGNPVVEQGFFIFKNSWGTNSFGVEHPNGPGYGYISYRYVDEEGSVYVSDLPEVILPEVCNDGEDNDKNGSIDCDDAACASAQSCANGSLLFENTTPVAIPDNDPTGARSDIVVSDSGTIGELAVNVDISHTYKGDLTVKLVKDDGTEIILQDRQGGGADDINETFAVTDFAGQDMAGTWSLVVVDGAGQDVGTINSWSIEVSTDQVVASTSYESTESVAIPDNDPVGVFTNIDVADAGDIAALKVDVTIDHTYKGDLTVKLQKVGEPGEVILQQADASSGDFGTKSFNVSDFNGVDASGTWRLTVTDNAAQDVGTLHGWTLHVTQ